MSFSGSGGSSSSIHGSSDVALNNPADQQVLSYNASLSKWQNSSLGSTAGIAQLKGGAVYVEDYGAVGDGTTDDSSAIISAINAAVATAQSNGSAYAEIRFQAKNYLINATPTKGGATAGNAIIPLPIIHGTDRKVTILLRGEGSAAYSYWLQQTPQLGGTTLFTTNTAPNPDGTYGAPSLIGCAAQGYNGGEGPNDSFSNVLIMVRGLRLAWPKNAGWVGFDFNAAASADLDDVAIVANVPAVGTAPNLTTRPTNSNEIGLIMPGQSNNDISKVGSFTAEGIFYGIVISEHFNADRLGFLYCNTGVYITASAVAVHGASIRYVAAEYTTYPIWAGLASSAEYPLWIGLLDCEQLVAGGNHVHDSNGGLYGQINWADYQVTDPNVLGAGHLTIMNFLRSSGAVAAPSLPASATALQNPFWRHASIQIHGGTVTDVSVDGQSQGAGPAMVVLPSGRSISLTYSASPTWTWTLL